LGAPSLTRGRVCHLSVYSQSTVVSQYIHKIFTYCVTHNWSACAFVLRFRTDPLKTTLVTSQLRHPLRMDRPTENSASNSVTVLLCSNLLLVTMEMKSTSCCIATDICRLSLMWEAPTNENVFNIELEEIPHRKYKSLSLEVVTCMTVQVSRLPW
jgi:hypothetical protein